MYNAILIDDEEVMRESFHDFIPWNNLGFNLIAMIEDGEEALSFLKENKVDLVVTDIKLPFYTGIDIAQYVYENLPDTKVIVLSGYEDFNYARSAMKYGVKHYLLKNMSISDISAHITEVKEDLDSKIVNKNQIKTLIHSVKNHFINDIVLGIISSKDELIKRLDVTDSSYKILNNPCAILNIKINDFNHFIEDKWEFGKSGFDNAIDNLFLSNDDYIYSILKNNEDEISVFVSTYNQKNLSTDNIDEVINLIKEYFSQMFSLSVDIDIEKEFSTFFDIIDYNNQKKSVVLNDDIISIMHLLISHVIDKNYSEVRNIFNLLLEKIKDLSFNESLNIIRDLFESIYKNVDLDDSLLLSDFHKLLFDAKTDEELKKISTLILDNIITKLNDENLDYNLKIVEKSKIFIKDNCLSDISLSDVSNHVFLSPDYLGKLLKKYTNETFTDILLKERMEKSIELLKNDEYKIYEISQMVGYKTTKYFTKLFKKYKGITPTEYRNLLWR